MMSSRNRDREEHQRGFPDYHGPRRFTRFGTGFTAVAVISAADLLRVPHRKRRGEPG